MYERCLKEASISIVVRKRQCLVTHESCLYVLLSLVCSVGVLRIRFMYCSMVMLILPKLLTTAVIDLINILVSTYTSTKLQAEHCERKYLL